MTPLGRWGQMLSHSGLRMPVQHVHRDIRPEFTDHVGQRVPPNRVSVLCGERPGGPSLTWVILTEIPCAMPLPSSWEILKLSCP